jgi:hypothetical protein
VPGSIARRSARLAQGSGPLSGPKRQPAQVGLTAALLRLAGSVLVEAHDEWQVDDKRYLSETTLAPLNPADKPEQTVATPAAITA